MKVSFWSLGKGGMSGKMVQCKFLNDSLYICVAKVYSHVFVIHEAAQIVCFSKSFYFFLAFLALKNYNVLWLVWLPLIRCDKVFRIFPSGCSYSKMFHVKQFELWRLNFFQFHLKIVKTWKWFCNLYNKLLFVFFIEIPVFG